MKTILAPVDFSPVSEAVVNEAATLARTFDGRVILLAVMQPPAVLTEYSGLIDLSEVLAASEKNAARQLAALEERLRNQFVKSESVQLTGNPVAGIIEQAKAYDADYIVMGSHGHTALYDLLVGSTTHGVLMRAKCPVLIVPASNELSPTRTPKKRAAMARL